jgi:CHASE2 domain-containing sensor protein
VDTLRSRCPHTAVIPAEALMFGEEDADTLALIENRIVFYGASLEGSLDLAFSPANGLLPGVFVHAMALDNIITFRGQPKRDTVTWFGITLNNDAVKAIVVALILLIGTRMHLAEMRKAAGGETSDEVGFADRLKWYGLLLGMAIGSGVVLYLIFGLSIGNWIELVFISGILFELLHSPFLARQWGRLRYAIGM